jgi:hypothetical protein
MTQINKLTIAKLHQDLNAVLAEFAKQHDLSVGQFSIKYSATDFRTGAICFASKADGAAPAVDPRFAMDLRRRGFIVGLDSTMIGTEVHMSKGRMKFAGMRASKAVFLDSNGKPWLYDAVMAASLIKAAAK